MAGKLKISRLLGGSGKAYLGEYDTLGDFGKLGNVYAADGGFKDSPLAGGMLEVAVVGGDLFVIANPIGAFVPQPAETFEVPTGGDGGASAAAGEDGGGGTGEGGGEGGGDGGPGGGDGGGPGGAAGDT